ncbi:copper resistance protein NlpE N-terminal domain-containing protein [Pleomorphovibrio marinus]|uniref:copper resistance protein NlpE N-terminal domain-containing protein n=1 Tax=Pleomorphovibrio marinus TaxID=2164132 RepID=UPI000E0C9910|nr:copper resistance protein NlpE N-terminal domain-containing protein [Pleomorphovibrio marinus]
MNSHINYLVLIFSLIIACDSPSTEERYEGESPLPAPKDEIILEKETATWLSYEGIIPCADCRGIKMELRLENSPEKTERIYELSETYLDTKDGDRNFLSKGLLEVGYGIEGNPNAFVIKLMDEEGNLTRSFIQDEEGGLEMLDTANRRMVSEFNYTLIKIR